MKSRLLALGLCLVAACAGAPAATPDAGPSSTTAATTTTTTPEAAVVTTTTTTTTPEAHPIAGYYTGPADDGPRRLVIHAVGDVNFSLNHNAIFASAGYEIAWTGLDGLFTRDDLTLVNFECSPSELGYPVEKKWAFRCPLASLEPMRDAGVDVTNMANNHAGDLGPTALVDARENLIAAGFAPVGAGEDLETADTPYVTEIGGHTIAVLGMTTVNGEVPGWFATEGHPGVAPAFGDNLTEAVAAAAELADILIVTVHWGEGGSRLPTASDRVRAQEMIDAGADVIVGHHSHRLQPLEVIDGVPVFWSLGNFVWPNLGPAESTTAVAEIVIAESGEVSARLIPAYIVSHGHPELLGLPDITMRVNPPLR